MLCRPCMEQYLRVCLGSRRVVGVPCPHHGCGAELPDEFVESVLGPEDGARFRHLQLQSSLDGMADVAYCPHCNTPCIQDDKVRPAKQPPSACGARCTPRRVHRDLRCAASATCRFASGAGRCGTPIARASPPTSGCESSCFVPAAPQPARSPARSPSARQGARCGPVPGAFHGRGLIHDLQQVIEDLKSRREVERSATPCPNCAAPITKTLGCNKMTCSRCLSCFCWCCKKIINGYEVRAPGLTRGRPLPVALTLLPAFPAALWRRILRAIRRGNDRCVERTVAERRRGRTAPPAARARGRH